MALCWRSLTPPTSLFPASAICSDFISFVQSLHQHSITLHRIARFPLFLFLPNLLCFHFLLPNPSLSPSLCFTTCLTILHFLSFHLLCLCVLHKSLLFFCASYSLLSYSLHSRPSFVLSFPDSTLNLLQGLKLTFVCHSEIFMCHF